MEFRWAKASWGQRPDVQHMWEQRLESNDKFELEGMITLGGFSPYLYLVDQYVRRLTREKGEEWSLRDLEAYKRPRPDDPVGRPADGHRKVNLDATGATEDETAALSIRPWDGYEWSTIRDCFDDRVDPLYAALTCLSIDRRWMDTFKATR